MRGALAGRWLHVASLASLALLTSISACGGSAAPESADAACTELYTAVCAQLEACSPIFPILDGDRDACVARRASQCKKGYLRSGSKESAAQLSTCFRAMAPSSCETLIRFLFEYDAPPSACDNLAGLGANGAPCAAPDQCASQVCIEQAPYVADDDPCGHCGAGEPLGGRCETLLDCARGLACVDNVCSTFAERGMPCDKQPCHVDSRCVAGTCVALAKAGEACAAGPPTCDLDLQCNTVRGVCVAPTATGGEGGATCGVTSAGDYDACARGFVCNLASNGKAQCLALAGAGEACVDRPCAIPLRCIHGTCQLQDAQTCH